MSSELERVREAAKKDRKARFTALFHHLTLARLRSCYVALSHKAAAGVDGVTWVQYGERLEENLQDLDARLHRGAYRAQPSRRVFIPKSDGQKRPLGIAVLEDKIVQRAVVEVMNAIYEVDFLGFSYGFRPGRSAHMALDALSVERAFAAGAHSYQSVKSILEQGLDRIPIAREQSPQRRSIEHEHLRGPKYYN